MIMFIEQQIVSISDYWSNETICYIFKKNAMNLGSLFDILNTGKFLGSLTKKYVEEAIKEYEDLIELEPSVDNINLILNKQNEYLSKFRNACLLIELHYPEYYEKNDFWRS